jgi:hypothetical protein
MIKLNASLNPLLSQEVNGQNFKEGASKKQFIKNVPATVFNKDRHTTKSI